MASLEQKAYARSLLHHELYIRASRAQRGLSEQTLQAGYAKHQELYAHMEDPDGMDGLSALITSKLSKSRQEILKLESAGRWNEALVYYESDMQENPGKFDNYAGLYKCHDNLGQFSKQSFVCLLGDLLYHYAGSQY
jgi:serine/threonine-protein kinase ATR